MSFGDSNINVVNNVAIKDRGGNLVSFQGVNHYDATSLFSDTVDLPTPGYLYVPAAGDVNLMLVNTDTALVYTFDSAGIQPLLVKRILSTSTTVSAAYIIM